jgi:8-oxo-dGTP pyrophosphatase MutT (NUDIX family)
MPKSDRPAFLRAFDEVADAAIRGWERFELSGLRARARANPRVGLMELWVTVMKLDGRGGETPCYEIPKIFENQVVVVIIENAEGCIAFGQNYRLIGHRVPGVPGTQYVQRMQQDPGLVEASLDRLGMWQWELPLGFCSSDDPRHASLTEQEIVFECARREALEEVGCVIDDLHFVGWVHMEAAYVPYPCAVLRARVVSQDVPRPEEHELIGGSVWFSPAEIRARIDDGSLGSGVILGALLMAGIQIPPSTSR